jgi:acyl-CoA-dependent ceramide synthase
MQGLWADWPQRELDGMTKGYVLGQWCFWLQQILVVHLEDRRKDYWQMLAHHLLTIAIIAAAYAYHQTRVGSLIMMLMDAVDLVFPVSDISRVLNLERREHG